MDCENLITLMGNVGKDPETQRFDNGGMVAVLTLATSEGGYTKKTGEQVPEVTQWHRVAGYGRLAEYMARYIRKGARLYVRGKLKYYEATTPGGDKYSVAYVEAEKVTQLDRRQQSEPLPGDVSVAELKRRYPNMPLDENGEPYMWEDGRVRTIPFKPGERSIKWYGENKIAVATSAETGSVTTANEETKN